MLSGEQTPRSIMEELKRELGEMVAAVRVAQASGDEGDLREAVAFFVSSYVASQLWFAADLPYISEEHEIWCMQVLSVRKRMPNRDAASQKSWDACRREAHISEWVQSMMNNAQLSRDAETETEPDTEPMPW